MVSREILRVYLDTQDTVQDSVVLSAVLWLLALLELELELCPV